MSDDRGPTALTVGQVAARLGVTVRTLHHWDEIGLAHPSTRAPSGYRSYGEADVERLRRVVVYRELGLDLASIAAVLDDPERDVVTALREQRDELATRIRRLRALQEDVDRMIEAHEHGLLMSVEEQAAAFGRAWDPSWPAQARQRYGGTVAWQQYAERSASRTPDDWRAVAAAAAAFDEVLAAAMDRGVAPGSPEADALVDDHRAVFAAYFPITREVQVVLGRMYEADPAYAAHYDGVRTGLASWLRQLIDTSARAHGIDPDAARWPAPPGPAVS